MHLHPRALRRCGRRRACCRLRRLRVSQLEWLRFGSVEYRICSLAPSTSSCKLARQRVQIPGDVKLAFAQDLPPRHPTRVAIHRPRIAPREGSAACRREAARPSCFDGGFVCTRLRRTAFQTLTQETRFSHPECIQPQPPVPDDPTSSHTLARLDAARECSYCPAVALLPPPFDRQSLAERGLSTGSKGFDPPPHNVIGQSPRPQPASSRYCTSLAQPCLQPLCHFTANSKPTQLAAHPPAKILRSASSVRRNCSRACCPPSSELPALAVSL
jgi:hypothetical protein